MRPGAFACATIDWRPGGGPVRGVHRQSLEPVCSTTGNMSFRAKPTRRCSFRATRATRRSATTTSRAWRCARFSPGHLQARRRATRIGSCLSRVPSGPSPGSPGTRKLRSDRSRARRGLCGRSWAVSLQEEPARRRRDRPGRAIRAGTVRNPFDVRPSRRTDTTSGSTAHRDSTCRSVA